MKSITFNTGATLDVRILTQTNDIAMAGNTIVKPFAIIKYDSKERY